MKTNILVTSLSILLFIGFMSISFNSSKQKVVFSFMNETPNLPETPYSYSDIEFPQHIFDDNISTGYDGHPTDTTILDFVDDNISTLGRVLFYDEKLSALENLSCASCHSQEFSFAENKQFSQGISSLTTRNSMALNDLSWEGKMGFFWDMEFSELEDMLDIPFKDENEIGAEIEEVLIKMNATEYYPELFEKAYGDAMINEERIIEALANFIGSMVTFNSKFDKEADNSFAGFTENELAGQQLFTMNCTVCHSSVNLFGPDATTEDMLEGFPHFFNNGLEAVSSDLGAGDWFPGGNGLFKITSLRNIELTGPYMHNGSLETLSDVIDFYSEDVQENDWPQFFIPPGGFGFNNTEKEQLLAFLHTLTDESFKTNPKWSDPFVPFTVVNNVIEEDLIDLKVFPNPMASSTTITLQDNDNSGAKIIILDQMGKQVFTDSFEGSTYNFNNYILPSGIYNVIVQNDKGKNTLQLVVQ